MPLDRRQILACSHALQVRSAALLSTCTEICIESAHLRQSRQQRQEERRVARDERTADREGRR